MTVLASQHSIVKSAENVMSIVMTLCLKYALPDLDRLMYVMVVKRLVSVH